MATTYTDTAGNDVSCPNHIFAPTCSGEFTDEGGNMIRCNFQGDGTDSSNCPEGCTYNPSSEISFDKTWTEWSEITSDNTDLSSNISFNENCFNICGEGNYMTMEGGRPTCQAVDSCVNDQITDSSPFSDMCNNTDDGGRLVRYQGIESTPVWFVTQKSANMGDNFMGGVDAIVWDENSLGQNPDDTELNNFRDTLSSMWTNADRPLSDNEIRGLMGGLRTNQLMADTMEGYVENVDDGEFYNNFPEGYIDMTTLRNDINEGRGSVVKCHSGNAPSWDNFECSGTDPRTDGDIPSEASQSHFGPEHIIYEEVIDFFNSRREEMARELVPTGAQQTEQDRVSLMGIMGDAAANPLFEECMNELFETDFLPSPYESELEIMNEIRSITNINDLTQDHITYIRLKLKKIAQTDETDAVACMNRLNIGESICNTGISDKILKSAYLVSAMMGMNNLDVSTIERGTPEYMRLTRLINELGYLLPQAFKKIIDISLFYEEQYCGSVTTSTRVLEKLYENLYENNRNVEINIMPSFDINTLIDNDPIYFFQKMAIIFVIAYSASIVLRALKDVKKIVE